MILSLHAENNATTESNLSNEINSSMEINSSSEINSTIEVNSTKEKEIHSEANNSKEAILARALKEQMEREEKFAKEQTFYQGDDYDLSYAEVNEESLDSVPLIEPEYDFNMDDVYN
jgi:hypothetical protein